MPRCRDRNAKAQTIIVGCSRTVARFSEPRVGSNACLEVQWAYHAGIWRQRTGHDPERRGHGERAPDRDLRVVGHRQSRSDVLEPGQREVSDRTRRAGHPDLDEELRGGFRAPRRSSSGRGGEGELGVCRCSGKRAATRRVERDCAKRGVPPTRSAARRSRIEVVRSIWRCPGEHRGVWSDPIDNPLSHHVSSRPLLCLSEFYPSPL